ncbi:MAG: chalcone isomerase family protein [Myxococcota bacterium]
MKRLVLILSMVLAAPALAGELEGVKADDTITVGGKSLVLNGQGLRKKFLFKVYVASLYLEQKSNDPAAILAADGVRQVKMTMLRDLEKAKITDAIKEGFKKNAGDKLASLQERLDKLCDAVSDLKSGQTLVIDYVPGKGTTVSGSGKTYTAEGKDFADAMFSVWLGKSPVDEDLKRGMLGK